MRILVLLALLSCLGCVTPCHKACDAALAPEGLEESTSLTQRNRVHVVIVNGHEPFVSFEKLRMQLNDAGFAKVSVGGLLYKPYFEAQIRKIARDDPEARFVVIGYGIGVPAADSLAAKLHGEGVQIETVIALAPRLDSEPAPVPRIVVRGRSSATPLELVNNGTVFLESSDVAGDEALHELVIATARDLSVAMPQIDANPPAVLALIDDPAPLPLLRDPKPVRGILTNRKSNN